MSTNSSKRVSAPEENDANSLKENINLDNKVLAEVGEKRKPQIMERPRRKRTRTKKKPNASMYVGYVEDGETVEMIMKKFQRLEEIQARNKVAEVQDSNKSVLKPTMSEKDLEEVFNETANFRLDKASSEGLHTYNYDEIMDVDEEGWDMTGVMMHESEEGEIRYYFGDGTDDDLWDELFGTKKKRSTVKRSQIGRFDRSVTKIAFVSDMHGRYVTGLRKIRRIDPNAIAYQRVPKDLPLSWAKIIKPYAPPEAIHTRTQWRPGKIICLETQHVFSSEIPEESELITLNDIKGIDLRKLASTKESGFQGIVLSPPWRERFPLGNNRPYDVKGIVPEDLLKLDLGNSKIISAGFIYIWTPKHLLHEVIKVMEKMNFFYVENAINVRLSVSNKIVGRSSNYFKTSKETLLILRRGVKNKGGKVDWSRVEIRHQRTSDVNFTYYSNDPNGFENYAHSYIHNMAETMLPHGRFNPLPPEKSSSNMGENGQPAEAAWLNREKQRKQQGRLLHIWAPAKIQRTGWVSVVVT